MKQIAGLALFCFGLGVLVMLVIDNGIIGLLLSVACLAAGYYIFCWC